jgi:hypothetical protein
MRKYMAGGILAMVMFALSGLTAENDYHVYAATNLSISGVSATGTVVNTDFAVMEVFSIGSQIRGTSGKTATNTIVLKILPYGTTNVYTIPGVAAQVEGSETTTALSTNVIPVYLYAGDTLRVIQTLASGTNALAAVAVDYHIKTGAKR